MPFGRASEAREPDCFAGRLARRDDIEPLPSGQKPDASTWQRTKPDTKRSICGHLYPACIAAREPLAARAPAREACVLALLVPRVHFKLLGVGLEGSHGGYLLGIFFLLAVRGHSCVTLDRDFRHVPHLGRPSPDSSSGLSKATEYCFGSGLAGRIGSFVHSRYDSRDSLADRSRIPDTSGREFRRKNAIDDDEQLGSANGIREPGLLQRDPQRATRRQSVEGRCRLDGFGCNLKEAGVTHPRCRPGVRRGV